MRVLTCPIQRTTLIVITKTREGGMRSRILRTWRSRLRWLLQALASRQQTAG
jgi:hypothetical protein